MDNFENDNMRAEREIEDLKERLKLYQKELDTLEASEAQVIETKQRIKREKEDKLRKKNKKDIEEIKVK